MFGPKAWMVLLLAFRSALTPLSVEAQEPQQSEREVMYQRYLEFSSYVKGGHVEPRWMKDGSSFWYTEGAPENTIIYKVNPEANTKTPLFDTARLREALGHKLPHQGLPFEKFAFVGEGEQAVKFTVEDKQFILQLDSCAVTPAPSVSEEEQRRLVPQIARKGAGFPDMDLMEIRSPDGRWFAFLKDRNVWLRSTTDGRRVQLTTDGKEGYEWRDVPLRSYSKWASWSPDSAKLAVKKGDYRNVPKIPIVDYLKPREEVR